MENGFLVNQNLKNIFTFFLPSFSPHTRLYVIEETAFFIEFAKSLWHSIGRFFCYKTRCIRSI